MNRTKPRDCSIAVIVASFSLLIFCPSAGAMNFLHFFSYQGASSPIVDGSGNAWVAATVYMSKTNAFELVRLSKNGHRKHFVLARDVGDPSSDAPTIALGPRGSVWTAVHDLDQAGVSYIYRVSKSGKVRRFAANQRYGVSNLTLGPDSQMWFVGSDARFLFTISYDGNIHRKPFRHALALMSIVRGRKAVMWATSADRIYRIPRSGRTTSFPAPKHASGSIAIGQDGKPWIAADQSIVQLTPSGLGASFTIADASQEGDAKRFAYLAVRSKSGLISYVSATFPFYPADGNYLEQPSVGSIESDGSITEQRFADASGLGNLKFDLETFAPHRASWPTIDNGEPELAIGDDGTRWVRSQDGIWEFAP